MKCSSFPGTAVKAVLLNSKDGLRFVLLKSNNRGRCFLSSIIQNFRGHADELEDNNGLEEADESFRSSPKVREGEMFLVSVSTGRRLWLVSIRANWYTFSWFDGILPSVYTISNNNASKEVSKADKYK